MSNPKDLENLIPELCRNNFKYYIKYMMPHYEFNWHHEEIVESLEAVERGEILRLAIFQPPRHGKSELASKLFPSWYLGRNPNKEIIQAGYSQDFVNGFGRHVRNTLKYDERYKHIFPHMDVSDDSKAIGKFAIKGYRGNYFAAGVGGPMTGRGADLGIIDDPIKNADDVRSDILRESIWEWYTSTFYTRLMPGAAIVLILTRWHADDLAGRILANDPYGKWNVISYPAVNEEKRQALWPTRYSFDTLMETKQTIGPQQWSALYMQDPIIDGGNIIKQAWFKYYKPENLPEFKMRVWSIDTAVKTGQENDYSVAQYWGEAENGFYLLKQVRGKFEYPDLKNRLRALFNEYPADEILIEDASSGQQLVQDFKITTFPVVPMIPGKNMPKTKEERLYLASPLFETGKIFFPEKMDWVFDLEEELIGFPNKKHDDTVDALTQFTFRAKQRRKRNNNVVVMPITAGSSLKYN